MSLRAAPGADLPGGMPPTRHRLRSVVKPEVVFLDEPTTGLDPRSRQAVWTMVAALRTDGITTLLTTQYLEEADQLSDNIIVIDRGRVVAEGTAAELKDKVGARTARRCRPTNHSRPRCATCSPSGSAPATAANGQRHRHRDPHRSGPRGHHGAGDRRRPRGRYRAGRCGIAHTIT